jgi:hypothetical protein
VGGIDDDAGERHGDKLGHPQISGFRILSEQT